MNGAQSLVHTLIDCGVDTCFANPGTSEMHFVAALDTIPGIKCVLGLQENVVTGMADGYFRMTRKPASTLLHCGPGLSNGLANLHNARRARSGIVNIVGDHATYHTPLDPPLATDTEALARTVSAWVRTSRNAADVGRDAAVAVAESSRVGGGIASLILPSDASWGEGGMTAVPLPVPSPPHVDTLSIENAAKALRNGGSEVLLLLGGEAVLEESQGLAWRIAAATGAKVMAEFSCARVARGQGRMQLERVPYMIPAAVKTLSAFKTIVMVNAKPPVAFFAYPEQPSRLYRDDSVLHTLSRVDQDPVEALKTLVEALKAPVANIPSPGERPSVVRGASTPEGLAQTIAAIMPDNAIVSDESVSYGRAFYRLTHAAPAHDWLHLTGGAIGDGMPVATGAAIAAVGKRRVISLQADGSAMYTVQALWTQAREKLPVTTVILSNRRYNILIGEYENVGATPGQTAMNMLDLSNPAIDWVRLAGGLGVEASRAETLEQCADLMRQSFLRSEPFLVELAI
jgi:acetolactate synthase I/II/III large subunit